MLQEELFVLQRQVTFNVFTRFNTTSALHAITHDEFSNFSKRLVFLNKAFWIAGVLRSKFGAHNLLMICFTFHCHF